MELNGQAVETIPRAGIALIVLASLILNVAIFRYDGGIRPGGDTPGYLSCAEGLLAGRLPPGKGASYLGYEAVVAFNFALGTGLGGVIVFQWACAALAAAAQYDLGRRLGGT